MKRLRQFVALSFAIKVDEGSELPDRYSFPPSEVETLEGPATYAPWESETHRWYGVTPSMAIPIGVGKKGNKKLLVDVVQMFHSVTTVGYVISERKSRLRPDLDKGDKTLTTECIKLAKSKGEIINLEVDVPLCAYVCDTTVLALYGAEEMRSLPIRQTPSKNIKKSSNQQEVECSKSNGIINSMFILNLNYSVLNSLPLSLPLAA
jgi:hypothetical protein